MPFVRRLRPWIAAACVAGAIAGPAVAATSKSAKPAAPAAAKECKPSAEEVAIHVRALKEEMMVGALSCDSRIGYGEFVRKFEKQLTTSGKHMQSAFKGHGGVSEMDRFNTKLANEAMRQHMEKGTPVFCADSKKLYDEVLALNGDALIDYAQKRPVPIASPIRSNCPVPKTASAAPVGSSGSSK
ncbi:hypothetical protein TMPK1_25810 [Rhodospirillales bacterium TMPK1]|uniref:DUF2383 domain-containing protein n=1 Tax=Roseiterribacter gracilis TaxID=2812848 RepID=A0A8S8XCC8_9PROT|nr:hypothetical protein TMPK1_25810 [Rhodospirillales bacterium TMPK1]